MVAPVKTEITYALYESDNEEEKKTTFTNKTLNDKDPKLYNAKIVWRNVFAMILLHGLALYALLTALGSVKVETFLFASALALFSTVGVQAGAHRLWSHRAYKANFGVRLFLSLCHVLALQNDLYEWCRDHRFELFFIYILIIHFLQGSS